MRYPKVLDESLVGTYPAIAKAGGGYVWDAVLEYRVWCHPELGAPDIGEGSDYYHVFASYDEAFVFSRRTKCFYRRNDPSKLARYLFRDGG